MAAFLTIGVIARRGDPQIAPAVASVCAALRALDREVCVDTDVGIPDVSGVQAATRAQIAARCQLAVVIGGDGTLLSAARDLAPAGVPILGVNQGRLGFMVDVRPEEFAPVMRSVLAGDYHVDERLLLQARLITTQGATQPMLAVNDVVIRNLTAIRMLEFETWLDGEFISRHRADGFIVATPTGSTAYALSGGGPVLHPNLDALALVPICPHTLSDRPIVVGAGQTVRIILRGDADSTATFTCDGQNSGPLRVGESLEIARADARLHLIHPHNYSYFNILRSKLQWGRGPAISDHSL